MGTFPLIWGVVDAAAKDRAPNPAKTSIVNQRDAPRSPSANSSLTRPEEKAAQSGAASRSPQMRLTFAFTSPHPYLGRFGHGHLCCPAFDVPHFCPVLPSFRRQLSVVHFCRPLCYQRVLAASFTLSVAPFTASRSVTSFVKPC